jgi:hypothetical protein
MRLVLVLALLAALAVARWLYRRWVQDVRSDAAPVPRLPAEIVAGADRTWVLFTTPWCATCAVVEDELRAREPGSRVVKVDATRDLALADAFRVRAAPTVLLADGRGDVQARLVGVEAVRAYAAEPA